MKDWLSIGQIAKQAGVTTRALRVYEEAGLLQSHTRGENGYRYYRHDQLELLERIKQFKTLGFSLSEIKFLIQADIDPTKLKNKLALRLQSIAEQERDLSNQKSHIKKILSSLNNTSKGLGPSERRYIMSQFEKLSIVVTGMKDLVLTANYIREHLRRVGQEAIILEWDESTELPETKPYILIIPEKLLSSDKIKTIMPSVVVIKNLSEMNSKIESHYLNLYSAVGPHMTTVFNADDRLSVQLAANNEIRKGRTYYFSKNSGLEDQIQEIGGVVSDGEKMNVFSKTPMVLKLDKVLGFDEEIALMASLTAVMETGITLSTQRFRAATPKT
jgi:DNA-binding transcriptional MerR regulator